MERLFLVIAFSLSLFLSGCAQSPKDIRQESNKVAQIVDKNYEELASCMIAQLDESLHFGLLKLQSSNSLRTYSDRAEIISKHQDATIAVVDIKKLSSTRSEVIYNTSSYQMFLYTGTLQQKMKNAVNTCAA